MGTKINNGDLIREEIAGAKINLSTDKVPNELAEKVISTMEVNPKLLRRCNIVKRGTATNATSATIYTTPTEQDFYLCGVGVSVIKDATSTSTATSINATIDGVAVGILSLSGITLTAQENNNSLSIVPPIKIDKGTNITVTNTTNVANIRADGNIIGYLVDF